MIYLNYTKSDISNINIADALYLELNLLFPDQVFIDLSNNNYFWNLLQNSNDNIFIFLNSKHFYDDPNCWQRLDQAWKFFQENKIKKIIEIKLDNSKSPNFIKKDLVWIKHNDDLSEIVELIAKGINNNDWKKFEKITNFIYVKAYYKNILENNQAVLVNENQDWDVVIVKIKAIHNNIDWWSYSVVADQIWIDDFYTIKPLITNNPRENKSSEPWLKANDLFYKTVIVDQAHNLNCNNWQSFIFFKDFFEAYEITNISLTIKDLEEHVNYTIQVF